MHASAVALLALLGLCIDIKATLITPQHQNASSPRSLRAVMELRRILLAACKCRVPALTELFRKPDIAERPQAPSKSGSHLVSKIKKGSHRSRVPLALKRSLVIWLIRAPPGDRISYNCTLSMIWSIKSICVCIAVQTTLVGLHPSLRLWHQQQAKTRRFGTSFELPRPRIFHSCFLERINIQKLLLRLACSCPGVRPPLGNRPLEGV
jgi:hypothetical protein